MAAAFRAWRVERPASRSGPSMGSIVMLFHKVGCAASIQQLPLFTIHNIGYIKQGDGDHFSSSSVLVLNRVRNMAHRPSVHSLACLTGERVCERRDYYSYFKLKC